MSRNRSRNLRMMAIVLLVVSVLFTHLILDMNLLYHHPHQPPPPPPSSSSSSSWSPLLQSQWGIKCTYQWLPGNHYQNNTATTNSTTLSESIVVATKTTTTTTTSTTTTTIDNDSINGFNRSSNNKNPFQPPLYGYNSIQEMYDRSQRFPSIQQRVQLYMSNWYLPPCEVETVTTTTEVDTNTNTHTNRGINRIQYRYNYNYNYNDDDNNRISITGQQTNQLHNAILYVQEIQTKTIANRKSLSPSKQQQNRIFQLDGNTTLGKIHYMDPNRMLPQHCISEYCYDFVKYWMPAMERAGWGNNNTVQSQSIQVQIHSMHPVPVLFQFSDEEFSTAYSPQTQRNEPYPILPHLKKSRLSLLHPQELFTMADQTCSTRPMTLLPTTTTSRTSTSDATSTTMDDPQLLDHVHPIIYKLKSNRHYGALGKIPQWDIPWSQKKDQAIFRGTLTGMLPPGSRFSLATKYSKFANTTLSDPDATEKCLQLDRCRLVYQINQYYDQHHNAIPLVDAKLVTTQLQHLDMPDTVQGIPLIGNRMSKEEILQYKAIIMLEGNDAGTGLKWALFSNSVVMAIHRPKFTSWAMEEMLQPWIHYIPLEDPANLAQDIQNKMQWIMDHDSKAQQIAHQGQLWIRDLILHPNATREDQIISERMVQRYMKHFQYNEGMPIS